MAICQKTRRKKRRFCIADFDTLVMIQSRQITPPAFGAVDYDEDFSEKATVWAMIETTRGNVFFDGIDTDREITHQITIRFMPWVTAEDWVLLDEDDDQRLDIVDVEDLDNRHEYLLLRCSNRGSAARVASSA